MSDLREEWTREIDLVVSHLVTRGSGDNCRNACSSGASSFATTPRKPMQRHDFVLRDLGNGLTVLMLLAPIKKMKPTREERCAVGEILRDVADEIEERVFAQ